MRQTVGLLGGVHRPKYFRFFATTLGYKCARRRATRCDRCNASERQRIQEALLLFVAIEKMSVGSQGQQAGQRALTQSKDTQLKSYKRRLREDTQSVLENFTEILKLAKVEDETQVSRQAQGEQDQTEMQVRAANIVRAGESLISLVADIKQFLILNDFPLANENIEKRARFLKNVQNNYDGKLMQLRDELSNDLYEIEEEYYSSRYN